MPITVTATTGILDETAESQILPRLSDALLTRNGLKGNAFMTPLVVGWLHHELTRGQYNKDKTFVNINNEIVAAVQAAAANV